MLVEERLPLRYFMREMWKRMKEAVVDKSPREGGVKRELENEFCSPKKLGCEFGRWISTHADLTPAFSILLLLLSRNFETHFTSPRSSSQFFCLQGCSSENSRSILKVFLRAGSVKCSWRRGMDGGLFQAVVYNAARSGNLPRLKASSSTQDKSGVSRCSWRDDRLRGSMNV